MFAKRVFWMLALATVLVICVSGQSRQQEREPREPGGPPHLREEFNGAIRMAEENLARIREEVRMPDLSEEEESVLDALAVASMGVIKNAEQGLQRLDERAPEAAREARREVRMAQMEMDILHRQRGKFGELARLTREGEETGTLDLIQPSIEELEMIFDEIIEIERLRIELEFQLMAIMDEIMSTVEEARSEDDR